MTNFWQRLHLSTSDEIKSLPAYDHSTLAAIATCPREGMLKYIHHREPKGETVSAALRAGAAAHRFFAAWNGFLNLDLIKHVFTKDELLNFTAAAEAGEAEYAQKMFALEALYTNPDGLQEGGRKGADKIEASCLFWADQQTTKPHQIIAVEQQFSITVDNSYRYVGLMDLVCTGVVSGLYYPTEYKTTVLIDDGYKLKWQLHPQTTGYHIALQLIYGADKVTDFVMVEAQLLPLVKRPDAQLHMRVPYVLEDWHLQQWLDWANTQVAVIRASENVAPWMITIEPQCYRFRSVCPYLESFCVFDPETREEVYNTEMQNFVWEPYRHEQ